MQRQLADIVKGFERAQARLDKLADNIPDAAWGERTEPGHWSVAECVAHLNLTSEAYIPRIQAALTEAKAMNAPKSMHYKKDFAGAFFALMVGPIPMLGKIRIGKVKTTADFVPKGNHPKQSTLAAFKRDQERLIELVREADGLPLDKVKIKSPFGGKISYNVYSAFVILDRHEHRHLDQAQLVWSRDKSDSPV
jgi:DinB family protein